MIVQGPCHCSSLCDDGCVKMQGSVLDAVTDGPSKSSKNPSRRIPFQGRGALHGTAPSRRPRVAAEFSESMQLQDEVSLKIGALLGKHLDSLYHDPSLPLPPSDLASSEDPASAAASESLQPDAFRLFEESPTGTLVVPARCETCPGDDDSLGSEQDIGFRGRLVSPTKHRNGHQSQRKGADEEATNSGKDDCVKRPRSSCPSSRNVLKRTKPATSTSQFEAGAQKFREKEANTSSSEDESEQERFASVVVHITSSDISMA